ncbi:L,D-transpeptidase family protein [Microbulbifer bruguierae]|uniref:L,D-transpeptidase family protein n=1 Tax=Microbulbifer bruguierae TaxID=3029061 RepID=A0ABY8ND01_9GAMM|nr:L,D-transpeptidase family protein [Microbulbifer bruguierae]WGL15952.1 L,D-transpeptidase family protein [Microbulbifer bruguierae]
MSSYHSARQQQQPNCPPKKPANFSTAIAALGFCALLPLSELAFGTLRDGVQAEEKPAQEQAPVVAEGNEPPATETQPEEREDADQDTTEASDPGDGEIAAPEAAAKTEENSAADSNTQNDAGRADSEPEQTAQDEKPSPPITEPEKPEKPDTETQESAGSIDTRGPEVPEKTTDEKTAEHTAPGEKPDNETAQTTPEKPTEPPEKASEEPVQGTPENAAAHEPKSHVPGEAIDFATAGDALRAQADHYRLLAQQWHPIEEGSPMRPGDQGPRVAQLRNLLQQYGDYSGPLGPVIPISNNPQQFGAALQLAVESYQRRHGMEVSGYADRATLRELARPPLELARLLELNAKRWDKLPSDPGERYVFINVPDYQLQLIDQRRVILSMKTVVGRSSKRTPEMTTKLTSVVFNPTWTVPRSILLTDLLPKARNNPEAMHKRGYRVVKYGSNTTTPISDDSIESAARGKATLRQISGPGNTLGRVKFVIPNKQAIYLHDTQAQSLFEHRHRAYSHGCIRLQQPEELAYALLSDQGWDRTRVAQATTGDESITIKVNKPPKLFIAYLTAWVDSMGRVQFRPDIYHRDE